MNQLILSATAPYLLGNTSPSNTTVGVWKLQVIGSTSPAWNGSIVPKVRVNGANPAIPFASLIAVPYLDRNTGVITSAGTAITTNGVYEVQCNGEDLFLDYTHTAGSATVYPVPMEGTGMMITSTAAIMGEVAVTTIPGAGTFGQVALNDSTATQIVATNVDRRMLYLSNPDLTNGFYVGGSGVTSSTGLYFPPNCPPINLGLVSGAVYGISDTGTPSAAYVEV